mmetsp:Transcript_5224/g.10741  ORF Transcript_5224/g.10741 Transcript_5224/m.10741 type:complete len:264 (+) Transcript_5224:102-893(+)|eukprot:CAMPEP_0168732690 /NCGR_PEP_ID=MMETSP0724-20121128/7898_1 /TAXON_ID=265536 /ORGANISM="Amphiprora sp., Strain CCMP467" /LENGTH=263 /DNA_ID=CAMNT_0008779711 /DNA_START=94 /DNA_END=885 /DNA_ORIENTATION=+
MGLGMKVLKFTEKVRRSNNKQNAANNKPIRESHSVKTERDDESSSISGEIPARRAQNEKIVSSGSIRFDIGSIVYHNDKLRDMDSEEEWRLQWYKPDEIKSFRQEQVLEAGNMFENSYRLTQEELGKVEEWKSVLVQTYQECVECSITSDPESATTTPTPRDPSEALVQLYRNEHAAARLVGLETNLLARFRGKVRRSVRHVLDEITSIHAQREPNQRHHSLLLDEERYRVVTVTAPAMDFLHRLALAQAEALARDHAAEGSA